MINYLNSFFTPSHSNIFPDDLKEELEKSLPSTNNETIRHLAVLEKMNLIHRIRTISCNNPNKTISEDEIKIISKADHIKPLLQKELEVHGKYWGSGFIELT